MGVRLLGCEGLPLAAEDQDLMPSPLISVILPTCNRTELLPVSAGSVLAQSWRDLELIVVDDASTQDVETAVRALGDDRVRYARRDVNGGPAAARNTGIAQARGEYVAFQDSDDEWALGYLQAQLAVLRLNPDAMLGLGRMFRVIGDDYRVSGTTIDGTISLEAVASRPVAYAQTWLVRRQVLEALGGFDEQLWLWEDWELLLRIAAHHRIVSVPKALALSARHRDSLTQDETRHVAVLRHIASKHCALFARLPRQRSNLYYQLAHRLYDTEGIVPARASFRRAWQSNPANAKAWIYWGLCLLHLGPVIARIRGVLRKGKPL